VWVVTSTPWPFYPPGKIRYPIIQEARWAPRPVWTGEENTTITGIRSSDGPARSGSLYRLLRPGPDSYCVCHNYTRTLIAGNCITCKTRMFPVRKFQCSHVAPETCCLLRGFPPTTPLPVICIHVVSSEVTTGFVYIPFSSLCPDHIRCHIMHY
jgi:hypothetical protein